MHRIGIFWQIPARPAAGAVQNKGLVLISKISLPKFSLRFYLSGILGVGFSVFPLGYQLKAVKSSPISFALHFSSWCSPRNSSFPGDRSGKQNPSTLIWIPSKPSVFHGPVQVDWLHKGSFISLEHSLSSVSPPGILPQVLSASCLRKHAAHPEPAPQILDISREHSVSGQFLLFTWDCRDGSHGITQQLSHSLGR